MVLEFLLDLLFPPRCTLCHKFLPNSKEPLCSHCAQWVLEQDPVLFRGKHFSLCVSPLSFEGMVRESIHRYKFGGRRFYAKTYAPLMASSIRRELGDFDAITFVPISKKRRSVRGYDQSELLAQLLGEILQKPALSCLKKCKHNPTQSGLQHGSERAKNVRGVYEGIHPEAFRGKCILLVDDIITTGATLEECSNILTKAGAKKVVCATLAMTK
ncbi:MAG: ComF family protein [Oscillospiraceae bacterium]|nr:ComF family protein [Oscillospiraceae bacterium]